MHNSDQSKTSAPIIVITGASGFVGRYLGAKLKNAGYNVLGLTRSTAQPAFVFPTKAIGKLEKISANELAAILQNASVIIHLAGRAHVMQETQEDPAEAYRLANVVATERLLAAATQARVPKIIFASTVKVLGEESEVPYTNKSPPNPLDSYGRTKLEAEQLVTNWGQQTGYESIILRLPLMHGPGAKGNLATLIKAIDKNIPLPLGAFKENKRSMLSLANLTHAILCLINLPTPQVNSTFLLSDQNDLAPADLARQIANQMHKPWCAILSVPKVFISIGLKALNKNGVYKRLAMPLMVDSSEFSRTFQWKPAAKVEDGLREMLSEAKWEICPLWKVVFDRLAATALALALLPIVLFCAVLVRLTSPGPALHWSKRVGSNNRIFLMPKFRTMNIHTPQVATHLMTKPENYLTPIGSFLRGSSLDELPQLWSVLRGDMSLVGPRPALFNQDDLVELRTKVGVQRLRPGITGHAQVNGRDSISIPEKVSLDEMYIHNIRFLEDMRILLKTFWNVTKKENISH
jgi:O-antigen biosynthesis protein WbqP